MKLYFADTLMPRKACAAALYLNSPVEFVEVDLTRAAQKRPEFLAMNPNGKVPVLEDGERTLWEANAIMCHLSIMAGDDLWPGDSRQIDVIRWLSWDSEHFTRYAGALYFEHIIRARFGLGEPDRGAVEEALGYFMASARVLDDHLGSRKFLVGDALTVADFAVGVGLPYADKARLPLDEFPAVRRWHDRLNELPAWREPFPQMSRAA